MSESTIGSSQAERNAWLFPGQHPDVFTTPEGTPYLQAPGCQMIMRPQVDLRGLGPFFAGFANELGFHDLLFDDQATPLSDSLKLVKFAGQGCYAAFGPTGRRKNSHALEYVTNIKKEGHGSVLEHPSFSFFLYGISRSLTHELVRHRAGVGFSQLSQRYVDGKVLRFVMGPEYLYDDILRLEFEDAIDAAAAAYERRAKRLMTKILLDDPSIKDDPDRKRELRKRVNQAARRCLPNETETWMTFTGNVRALRHILEMRAAGPAELEIRRLGMIMYGCLKQVEPELFSDYEIENLPDGTHGLSTPYRKV